MADSTPKGIEEGMTLRVVGHGMPAPNKEGISGDLFVEVHTESDPRFERQGAALITSRKIAITDAVLGCKLNIACLDGALILKIPPGTQPGRIFELKNKGLPDFNSHSIGSLYEQLRELINKPGSVVKTEQRTKNKEQRTKNKEVDFA